jgi:hypothetical protein
MADQLDRRMIDRIARAVVSGERGLGARADRLADRVAGMTRNQLAAMDAPGSVRAEKLTVRRSPLATESAVLRRLFKRVAKHLATTGRGGIGAVPRSR